MNRRLRAGPLYRAVRYCTQNVFRISSLAVVAFKQPSLTSLRSVWGMLSTAGLFTVDDDAAKTSAASR